MINHIYPSELQLNKAHVSDTKASLLDLHLPISDCFVKTTIYDQRDNFECDIVNFPFLDGDVSQSTSFSVYTCISNLYVLLEPGRVAQSVGHLTRKSGVLGSIPGLATYLNFSFRFFRKGSCQLLAKVCARSTG